ncbi:hypothetical protein KIPB_001682 [Kipferlia bialata]|uniref:Armadillo-type fold n=1 Tax=Kipferlia bialata TaxID=797122 RepID=A0A9K3CP77_9EUKA|nr:hypothetical protein KIPB_001682 [Kipferlia bialata]|eukprot:g1682.t1
MTRDSATMTEPLVDVDPREEELVGTLGIMAEIMTQDNDTPKHGIFLNLAPYARDALSAYPHSDRVVREATRLLIGLTPFYSNYTHLVIESGIYGALINTYLMGACDSLPLTVLVLRALALGMRGGEDIDPDHHFTRTVMDRLLPEAIYTHNGDAEVVKEARAVFRQLPYTGTPTQSSKVEVAIGSIALFPESAAVVGWALEELAKGYGFDGVDFGEALGADIIGRVLVSWRDRDCRIIGLALDYLYLLAREDKPHISSWLDEDLAEILVSYVHTPVSDTLLSEKALRVIAKLSESKAGVSVLCSLNMSTELLSTIGPSEPVAPPAKRDTGYGVRADRVSLAGRVTDTVKSIALRLRTQRQAQRHVCSGAEGSQDSGNAEHKD